MSETAVENHPCAGCGVLDDHPMIHVMDNWDTEINGQKVTITAPSFHFDCLPEKYETMIADDPAHEVTRAAIAQARKGVHGEKLRSFIGKQKSDNDVEAAS